MSNLSAAQLPGDIRVMIIDNHKVVRRGIAEIVDRADGLAVVAEAGTNVYGRAGEDCRRCRTTIEREKFMNRSSYFCPHCQPPTHSRR
ncbi:zinc finger domain-containing protein [Georgenia sp. TF02-10]|uniref:zinc finger domain-containing protein n=1 Tax=Georgenia sp. TF02-10 TaxID=2917725 RepID=UPI00352DE19A